MELNRKIFNSLCVAILFSFTLFFFGPANLYFTNILEFPFFFSNIWFYLFCLSIATGAVLTYVLVSLSQPIHEKASIIIFAFGILFWIQGNVLVWDYGLLDGSEIIWGDYLINGIIDTAVWTAILVLFFLKSSFFYRLIKIVSIFLVLTQLGGLLLTAHYAPEQPAWKNYSISHDTMFNFSSEKNVIILVLDMFQSDVFQEIINEDGSYKNMFEGFIYFRNALAGYPTTYPSIPLMLTGEYYDNSVPIQDFIKEISLTNSLPRVLMKNGIQPELYPMAMKTVYPDEKAITNIIFGKSVVGGKKILANMYQLTFFRYSPHFFKKHFYGSPFDFALSPNWIPDLQFMDKVIAEANISNIPPQFKFFHLFLPHFPFQINESLEYEDLPQDRTGFLTQSKAALKITGAFLDKLREIGAYNNSMIFVVADHGHRGEVNVEQLDFARGNDEFDLVSSRILASGVPLILFKPFNSSNEMLISDAPVSLSDIPKTICTLLDIDNSFSGASMLALEEQKTRERRFLYYTWEHEYWDKQYLPPMHEYIVTEHSWLNSSWRPTYRVFTSEGIKDSSPELYKWEEEITFGREGNAEQYQGGGWSGPEDGFTWTDGFSATLALPVSESEFDIELTVYSSPFLREDKHNLQRVFVFANGQKVDEWIFTERGSQEKKAYIPNDLLDGQMLYITFELPDAASPAELGISEDPRKLSMAVSSVVLSEVIPYKYGEQITFFRGGNAGKYQIEGWSGAEENFTWTDANQAVLNVPVREPESDVILSAVFHAFVRPDHGVNQQRVNVLVNDQEIAKWVITEGGVKEHKLIISRELLDGPLMEIVFELPDAASPAELGVSGDPRTLAIAMREIVLSDYRLGSEIDFTRGGNARIFQVEGWSGAEENFTWTDANRAVLRIPVSKSESDIILSAVFHAFVRPDYGVNEQRVNVLVNGHEVGKWVITDSAVKEQEVVIPKNILDYSLMEIVFELPDAVSPKEVGLSEDGRTLGIAVQSVTLNNER